MPAKKLAGFFMAMNKTVTFATLGCKLNFSETSGIAAQFEEAGYVRLHDGKNAGVVVVNTCTVTEVANKKSRQQIKKLVKQNPGAKVVVMGCFSQLKPQEVLELEGVDLVLGSANKFEVLQRLEALEHGEGQTIVVDQSVQGRPFTPSYSSGDRTRSFLKVQDGCDYYCSYCAIPKARGTSRSGTVEETVALAKEIVDKGMKEIILTGVNIGDFGRASDSSFLELIQALDQIEGLERLRISSIEPNLLTPEIIQFVATSRTVMPHFHIPLQCGTDHLLRKMRRRYTTDLYQKRIDLIRQIIPDACIAADVIIGVPGETAEEFAQTKSFLEKIRVSYYHVFTYSEREGTLAVAMPDQVLPHVRKERSKEIQALSDAHKTAFIQEHVGTERTVLFESFSEGKAYGFTDNYIRVEVSADQAMKNHLLSVKLESLLENGNVLGRIG